MRNADALGDSAGVVDVAAGAAGALAVGRGAVVVELQRDADDVIAGIGQQRRGHRGIDAARHRDDDARVGRATLDIETVQHGSAAKFRFTHITISAGLLSAMVQAYGSAHGSEPWL